MDLALVENTFRMEVKFPFLQSKIEFFSVETLTFLYCYRDDSWYAVIKLKY
jgi:hypothetical protein